MAQYGAKELANAFRTVRGNTLQIAREIPEDKYDFVAAPGVRSMSQLLRHIAYADMIYYDFHRDKHIDTLKGYDFGAMIARIHRRRGEAPRQGRDHRAARAARAGLRELGRVALTGIPRRNVHRPDGTEPEDTAREPHGREGARDASSRAADAHPAVDRHHAAPHAAARGTGAGSRHRYGSVPLSVAL